MQYLNEVQIHFQSFAKSRWFTRGWTLQELIAPKSVIFYSQCWLEIGTRSSLRSIITKIARIHDKALGGSNAVQTFSIAQKMSWASTRQTTRIEDLAYSLMGIFKVNMPMLYGEGARAFFRLQEEIIKKSDDQSIFAWQSKNSHGETGGLLAPSPELFGASSHIIRSENKAHPNFESGEISITNKGILTYFPIRHRYGGAMSTAAVLQCRYDALPETLIILWLDDNPSVNYSGHDGTYKRANYSSLQYLSSKVVRRDFLPTRICVQTEFVKSPPVELQQIYPPVFLSVAKRFEEHEFSENIMESNGRVDFEPQIGYINKFHFINFSLGCFVVKVTRSFVWKKIRVEVSGLSLQTAMECQRDGLVTTEQTWYSHPNPEDLAVEPPDRVTFPLSAGTHLLLIAIRSRIIRGVKTQEIELDICERVTSHAPKGPRLLETAARDPGQITDIKNLSISPNKESFLPANLPANFVVDEDEFPI